MNDLTLLLSIVVMVSLILYFVSFGLWWLVLIIGCGFYLLLRFLTGMNPNIDDFSIIAGNDSNGSGTRELPHNIKDLIMTYLNRKVLNSHITDVH